MGFPILLSPGNDQSIHGGRSHVVGYIRGGIETYD